MTRDKPQKHRPEQRKSVPPAGKKKGKRKKGLPAQEREPPLSFRANRDQALSQEGNKGGATGENRPMKKRKRGKIFDNLQTREENKRMPRLPRRGGKNHQCRANEKEKEGRHSITSHDCQKRGNP